MKSLEQQINELNENLVKQLPSEVLAIFGQSIHELKAQGIEESSIGTGEKFPDFNLLNMNSKAIALKELLKNGKVIVAFFRGSWCPYCAVGI
ncbi:redoxin family protein [Chitinophaga oryzae]|uniref:redoxin family protein n=1 Tax=Chitinophaga oryzae TaxID=2725414 RepID=UPI001C657A04|nr:redoxin family protein [Chitinophaga oryzae]